MSRLVRKPRCWTSGVARTVAPPAVNSREQVVSRKSRTLGGELLIGAILLAGNGDRLFQLAFDGITASKQLGNVLVGDLGLEVGVRHRLWSGQSILDRQHAKQDQVADDPDRHREPARSRRRAAALSEVPRYATVVTVAARWTILKVDDLPVGPEAPARPMLPFA